ncbi:MAG: hypothetical protein EOO59_10900 [Hymenobacter sp.]|nr:MAG: hypothetical protein EOO59_10900 [Hymenobacter sp.]
MLRFLCLPLLGLALLAKPAVAQTAPAARKTTTTNVRTAAPRQVPNTTPAARRADPLRGTNDNGTGQSGYAAPGEPIQVPGSGGKNTANYDGQPAQPAKNSTLSTPK